MRRMRVHSRNDGGNATRTANSLLIALITPRKVAQREAALLLHRCLGYMHCHAIDDSLDAALDRDAVLVLSVAPHELADAPTCLLHDACVPGVIPQGFDDETRGAARRDALFVRLVEREVLQCPTTVLKACLLYTSPSPRDRTRSRMPSSA